MELTILCKVVDNFGDIGVAWRMSKRFVELAEKENPKKIEKRNLVVDGLEAFFKIEKLINIMLHDKKAHNNKLTFIIPTDKKTVELIELSQNEIREML